MAADGMLQIYVELAGDIAPEAARQFHAGSTLQDFKMRLEKRLLKKGRTVTWVEGSAPVIIGVRLDPGNRWMRYLVPFSSPAVAEARGRWIINGRTEDLYAKGSAHFGILGGSPQGMLKVAAGVAADRIAKQILKMSVS